MSCKTKILVLCALSCCVLGAYASTQEETAYDIDKAKEICDERPLDLLEGIWIYPDDNVTVLVLKDKSLSSSALPSYTISVVDGTDCSLAPGDKIGKIMASAQPRSYEIELFTERKNNLLMKPATCMATLSKDDETLLLKKEKSKFKIRLNFNFTRLLPGFWKIVSSGISTNPGSSSESAPVGMVKIYPSYDGNGSSKRQPRYL